MAASIRKPARRKYSSMRCQTLVFRSGISMSATSSKVLQAKIACRNSSALFQHSSLNHRVLGYRSATSSCSFRSGNGSGLSPYSYSMEITRPCILIQYPMGLKRTGYLPLRGAATAGTAYAGIVSGSHAPLSKAEIIPSSFDPFLRKTVLQGFVHDESAAFQGGVSGNAGLFSNATEVARIYQMLLNGGELDGKRYLSPETCRVFTTTVSRISRRGLGFDKPDRQNPAKSPCAAATPSTIYGHTGFTGTCAWVDPTNGLVYVFLCNRIYPNVWNTKLMKMDIRTRIQEVMYQAVK